MYIFLLINHLIPANLLGMIEKPSLLYIVQFIIFIMFYTIHSRRIRFDLSVIILIIINIVYLAIINLFANSDLDNLMRASRIPLSLLIVHVSVQMYSSRDNKIKLTCNHINYLLILNITFSYYHLIVNHNSLIDFYNPRDALQWLGYQTGGLFVWSYSLGYIILTLLFIQYIRRNKYVHIYIIISAPILILTQSKSVFISCFLCGVYIFCKMHLAPKILIILLCIINISYLSKVYLELGNIVRFIDALANGTQDGSTFTRSQQAAQVWRSIQENVFGGGGPLLIETGYIHYLYFYGLIGFSLFIFTLFTVIRQHATAGFWWYLIILFVPANLSFIPLESPKAWLINCILFGVVLVEIYHNKKTGNARLEAAG